MNASTTPRSPAAELHRLRFLEGPILSTLITMAWPTFVQMIMFSFVVLLEVWFIGKLGVVSLAGASLVSPAVFLMQAMAGGGMGGAVTATIAKAAGGGNKEKVQSLAWHAILVSLGCGLTFSVVMVACGPWFYHLLGGSGDVLNAALQYSNVMFLAAPLMWLVIILSAILRGLGVVKVQAVITIGTSLLLLPLSPLLIFGFGPVPALGMRGAALAVICYYALAAVMYFNYLSKKNSVIKLHWPSLVLSRKDFGSILKLGSVSSLLAVQSHVTTLIITGLVGGFGTMVLAGFGAAARLQQVIDPFIFSLGTATVMTVATCVGAGHVERARKVAMTAALAATVFCGLVGGLAALFPRLWVGQFSQEAEVIAAGSLYLQIMGPFYWCIGLGLILYYCSQGIGLMRWSYTGSLLRLAIVSIIGTATVHAFHAEIASLYWIMASGMVVSCAITVFGIAYSDWKPLAITRGLKGVT
ncbi:MAG: MATE family efflux transporter [Burkholderiaceae bacterium]